MKAGPIGLHDHVDTFGLLVVQLTPPQLAPNGTVTQTYTAPGVEPGDYVALTTQASFSGTCLVSTFVPSAGQVQLTWLNTDNQTRTPAPSLGLLFFLRAPIHVSQGVLSG